jgi:hypothetical protein
MWYYYVAFVTEAGKLLSCRIDSKRELTDQEQAVELPRAIRGSYGDFTLYTCVLNLPGPTASILVRGGSVHAVFSTMAGLAVEVFDLDLVGDATTAKEQELRCNLTAGKAIEVEITNHYEKHG